MADKQVVVTLKLQPDPGNAAAAKTVADQVKRAQGDATTATRREVDRRTAYERNYYSAADKFSSEYTRQNIARGVEHTRSVEREQKRQSDLIKAGIRERMQEEKRRSRDISALEADLERSAINASKARSAERGRETADTQRAEREKASAAESASKQYATASARHEKANRQIVTSAMAAFGGVTSLAKGIALLGLAGEKDTRKIVDGIIQIEAGFAILHGSVSTLLAIGKLWDAIGKSIKTAAAAQAAYNVTAGVGGAVGGARAGSGFLGGLIGGRIGAGLAGIGGTMLMAGGAAVGATALATTSAILTAREAWKYALGGGASTGSLVEQVGGSKWNPFAWMVAPGSMYRRGAAEARTAEMEAAFAKRVSAQQDQAERQYIQNGYLGQMQNIRMMRAESSASLSGIGLSGARQGIAVNDAMRRASLSEAVTAMEERQRAPTWEAQKGALERQIAAVERLRELEKDRVNLQRDLAEESGRTLEGMKAQGKELKSQIDAKRESLQSAAERWLTMDPAERALALQAKRKAEAGQDLTNEERSALRGTGVDALGRAAGESAARQAGRDSGFNEISSSINKEIGDLAKQRADLDAKRREFLKELAKTFKTITPDATDEQVMSAMTKGIKDYADAVTWRIGAITNKLAALMDELTKKERDKAMEDQAGRARERSTAK